MPEPMPGASPKVRQIAQPQEVEDGKAAPKPQTSLTKKRLPALRKPSQDASSADRALASHWPRMRFAG